MEKVLLMLVLLMIFAIWFGNHLRKRSNRILTLSYQIMNLHSQNMVLAIELIEAKEEVKQQIQSEIDANDALINELKKEFERKVSFLF